MAKRRKITSYVFMEYWEFIASYDLSISEQEEYNRFVTRVIVPNIDSDLGLHLIVRGFRACSREFLRAQPPGEDR